jgi:hypothetical protein
VYVDGGRSAGLAEGMTLVVKLAASPTAEAVVNAPHAADAQPADSSSSDAVAAEPASNIVAKLKVVAVAETSAVCEIVSTTRPLAVGDAASLPNEEVQALVAKQALSGTRRYPAVISFTEGDPLDEEVRDAVPHPPLPEINMARGRIGFDYNSMTAAGGVNSSTLGIVFRGDITRIGGSYWNLSGYWRGRLDSRSSPAQQSLQDLLNRTYHLSLIYDNPTSKWVMGFGRMYLPWAPSLDTIDGGYFGRRLSDHSVTGFFAGTTPDPTSWSFSLNQRVAGTFINFSGGDYDQVHYTSTFGAGVATTGWRIDKPFVFGENDLSFHHVFSVYHSFELDRPRTMPGVTPVAAGLGRSYLTVRIQPSTRFELTFNHSYFRDLPQYDPQLVGTGLLDRVLFQGVSVGARVLLPRHVSVYTMVGKSNSSKDATPSLNTMYGVSVDRIWKTGLRADFRIAHFNSAFATGNYRAFSLSRTLGDRFMLEATFGTQAFVSAFSKDTGSRFFNARGDINLGANYFFEAGFTRTSGGPEAYRQWNVMLGYRFDNRKRRREEPGVFAGQNAVKGNSNGP